MSATLTICLCEDGQNNLGMVKCPQNFDVPYKFVMTSYFNGAGAVNGLDLKAMPPLTDAYFLALVNGAQAYAWKPGPQVLSVKNERADQNWEEFNEGLVKKAGQDGLRTVTAFYVDAPPSFVAKIKAWNCDHAGYFAIDESGNLKGMNSGYKKLNPMRIQKGSIWAKFVEPGYKTSQGVMFGWTIDPTEKDSDLAYIEAADMPAKLKDLQGLIDARIRLNANVAQTATTFTVIVETGQGDMYTPVSLLGLVKADATLTNQNTGAVITITTVTFVSEAVGYAFVVPTQVTGDPYRLTFASAGFNINYLDVIGQ